MEQNNENQEVEISDDEIDDLVEEEEQFEAQVQHWAQQMGNVQFWKFVNGDNFKLTLEKIVQNLAGSRKASLYRYLFDILLVLLLLGAVVLLGSLKILDGVTVGTLVGAIIGYALGRFRQG